jgi:hypothetical protein
MSTMSALKSREPRYMLGMPVRADRAEARLWSLRMGILRLDL